MKSSTRIIFQSVIPMVLLSWGALIVITMLLSSKDELSKIGGNYNLVSALGYVALQTPRRAYEYFVYGGAIGVIIGLGQLAQSSELIALQSLGISRRGIVLRGLAALALITLTVMGLAEWWGSYGDRRAAQILATASGTNISMGISSGLWIKDGESFINAKTVVVNSKGEPEDLWNVRVLQFGLKTKHQGDALSRILSAKSAHYLGKGRGWRLSNVLDQRFGETTASTTTLAELNWPSSLEPDLIAARAVRAERMSMLELYRNIKFARENKLDDRVFVSAIWQRVAFPFAVLSLALAAAPFVFGSLRTGGLGRSIFLGLLVAIGFFMIERLAAGLTDTFRWNQALGNLGPPLVLALWGWWRLQRA